MKRLILAVAVAVMAIPAFSQNAAEITGILKKDSTNYIDFSYLVASSAGVDLTPFEAYAWCDRFGTYPLTDTANTPLTPKNVSLFLMANYELKGGIMWTMTQNARYAFKELKYTGFWKQGTDPDTALSGRDLVRAVREFYSLHPDAVIRTPPTPDPDPKYREALLADKEATK